MPPADRDVLTSLPHSRSTRRSAKRAGTPQDGAPAADPAAKPDAGEATAKAAAKPKAKAKAKPKAKPAATATASPPPTSPPPPPAGWAAPRPGGDDAGRGELIGTAVQAVGELAQIGLAYGGRTLRQALSRLPRP